MFLDLNNNVSLAIRSLGESLFNKKKNLEVLKNVEKEKVSKDALFISKGIENVMLQFQNLR